MAGLKIGTDSQSGNTEKTVGHPTENALWRKESVPHTIYGLRAMSQYRVLIVDDHELVRRGLRDILRGTEFEVCGEAENGLDGFTQTVNLRPALVLLDMSMPKLTGLQAAVKIRQALPSTKILIITMHDSPQMEIEARAAGADAYITKMAAARSLVEAMRALVGTANGQTTGDAPS
jgi:DNA-binding NarL/FixJ family response regulator